MVWEEVHLSKGKQALPSFFIFGTKRDGRYKARLVAGGHRDASQGAPRPRVAPGASSKRRACPGKHTEAVHVAIHETLSGFLGSSYFP
jgi:hypothetical protein